MTGAARHGASDETGGAGFWLGVVVGGGIMAFGLHGLLDAAPATRPAQVGLALLGLDLLHDVVLAPLACVVGALLTRFLPRPFRAPVRAGLFASLVALLVGWPALRGYGRDQVPDNPTVAPLSYGTALLTVIAVIWAGVAVWSGAAWWRHRFGGVRDAAAHPGRLPGHGSDRSSKDDDVPPLSTGVPRDTFRESPSL